MIPILTAIIGAVVVILGAMVARNADVADRLVHLIGERRRELVTVAHGARVRQACDLRRGTAALCCRGVRASSARADPAR